eukprot:COSAG03_NODE_4084_length_1693_cov_1.193852_2_plen_68_part_00
MPPVAQQGAAEGGANRVISNDTGRVQFTRLPPIGVDLYTSSGNTFALEDISPLVYPTELESELHWRT